MVIKVQKMSKKKRCVLQDDVAFALFNAKQAFESTKVIIGVFMVYIVLTSINDFSDLCYLTLFSIVEKNKYL